MRPMTCLVATCLALATPAMADEAVDRLFDTEQMAGVETGTRLAFTHIRESHDTEALPDIERDIEVEVMAKDGKARPIHVSFEDGGRTVTIDSFSDAGGNPMLVFFLESVGKAVAKSTGGSPFYIKNRIVESFQRGTETASVELVRDGETITADRIVYSPFALEEKKDRLQNFATLELAFILSDAVPGRFIELRALDDPKGKGGFRESIVLDGLAEKSE